MLHVCIGSRARDKNYIRVDSLIEVLRWIKDHPDDAMEKIDAKYDHNGDTFLSVFAKTFIYFINEAACYEKGKEILELIKENIIPIADVFLKETYIYKVGMCPTAQSIELKLGKSWKSSSGCFVTSDSILGEDFIRCDIIQLFELAKKKIYNLGLEDIYSEIENIVEEIKKRNMDVNNESEVDTKKLSNTLDKLEITPIIEPTKRTKYGLSKVI